MGTTHPTSTPMPPTSPVTTVRGGRVSRSVLDHLRALVTSGQLAPGDRLPAERELADQLGVGRNSVREALRELEMLGLVEARQGAGTFVRKLDSGALMAPFHTVISLTEAAAADVMEFRQAFEPEVAALAATNADDDGLAGLQAALRRFDAVVRDAAAGRAEGNGPTPRQAGGGETTGGGVTEAPPADELFDADVGFHEAVARCTGNPLVVAVQHALAELFAQLRTRLPSTSYDPGHRAAQGHQALFGAIVAGDADTARQIMRGHLDQVEGSLLRELR